MSPLGRAWPRRRTEEPNAEGSPFQGYVEYPLPGQAVPRRLVVAGWHAWEGEAVSAVVVEVAGRVARAQATEVARDDLAREHGGAGYLRCGWHATLELGAVQEDAATVRIRVFPADDHGAIELPPIAVTFAEAPTHDANGVLIPLPNEVVGRLDVPEPGASVVRGAVLVRGWARTRDGAPTREVRLRVGDVELGRARLGLDRMDVAVDDESPAAALCGFEQLVDLTSLDRLDGVATLQADVVALDGTAATLGHDVVLQAPPAPLPVSADRARLAPPAVGAPMHLLCCTHDLGIGGAQLWLAELLDRAGAGRDFPCTVVTFAPGVLAERLGRLGIEVHVTSPLPVNGVAAYEGRLQELDAWLGQRAFTAALVNTFRAFPGADLARRRGLPVVWAVHESWSENLIWTFDHPGVDVDPEVRALAEAALAGAGAVVFESHATRRLYEGRTTRGVVVPYGVDATDLDAQVAAAPRAAARRALGIAGDRTVLLVMGTVEPRKAQGILVQAFAEVAQRHPHALLALVGDLHTPYSRAIGEFVARAGLGARVRLEPVTADAARWYAAADALVCGSDVESLPRSVLDAMALGLPVCATDVFGLRELLTDGETGLLFAPNELGDAIDALERLCSMDRDALATIGAKGRALVREQHGPEGYARSILALLRGLIDEPAATPEDLLARGPRP